MKKIRMDIEALRNELPFLTKEIVERQYRLNPELSQYGEVGRLRALEDAKYNLEYLFTAVEIESKVLFEQYNRWIKVLFSKLELPLDIIESFYICIEAILEEKLSNWQISKGTYDKLIVYIKYGKLVFHSEVQEYTSFVKSDNPYKDILDNYSKAIFASDKNAMVKVIKDASESGMKIGDIYKYVLQPFQLELGYLWHSREIGVAQEHYATALSQFAMTLLYERIFAVPKQDKVILGTCVQGELHEFGIRMICDYMESCGWNTYYLGANMPDQAIISMIKEKKPDVIAISCTMTFNISKLHNLVNAIKQAGITTPIMVGGYPFDFDKYLYSKVGADAYSQDFEEAYELAEKLNTRGE